MFFDGKKFTNNGKSKKFTLAVASSQARNLLRRYPLLRERGYHVWISQSDRRSNPDSPGIEEAAHKFENFTGKKASSVIETKIPTVSEGLVVGELDLIGYRVKRDGVEGGRMVRYGHQFAKKSRPLLAVSKDGKQLLIVGGRYEFTEAGIEDR
jgi:hypothetical protein